MSFRTICSPGVVLIAMLALPSCSRRGQGDDDEDACACHGDLPGGGHLDAECGESACVEGVGYRCVSHDRAQPDPDACGQDASDAGPGDHDAGDDPGVDAAAPADVCHSNGYSCEDGIPCCGTLVCDFGTCRDPESDCSYLGSDCAARDCCEPFECRDYLAGWRCAHPDSCADVGDPCADDGGCCGGLACEGGTCRVPTLDAGAVAYGEYCWDGLECASSPYCEDELCCIPADWTNDTCRDDAECCTGVCVGGICDCAPLGDVCYFYDDCCDADFGPMCLEGVCCLDLDTACDRDADCCSGSCEAGSCACLPAGASSPSSGQCCNLIAVNGRCG